MEAFAKRYINLRSRYIFPIKDYKIEYDKLEYNTIKEKLRTKIKKFSIIGTKTYRIEFNKDDLIKGLIGDTEYFITRALVQYSNIVKCEVDLSPCWSVVSQYYFSYFSATAVLRLLCRGNLYLDGKIAQEISNIGTVLLGEKIQIDQGNYIFLIKSDNSSSLNIGIDSDDIYMELRYNASRGTHEQTWLTIKDVIDEYINLEADRNDDEYVILKSIKDICDAYGATFPSQLRNRINYQPVYGYKSLFDEIKCTSIEIDINEYYKKVCRFNSNIMNENYLIENMYLYGRFFFLLVTKLYSEYINRSECDLRFYKDKRRYFRDRNINLDEIINISRI